mmetsp:Transcript_11766/g.27260  ORF Transcript_11766/g.27260 Transcript_11766/m.27260 type:complete len:269 (-) Transcript_11766:901-1707(-)
MKEMEKEVEEMWRTGGMQKIWEVRKTKRKVRTSTTTGTIKAGPDQEKAQKIRMIETETMRKVVEGEQEETRTASPKRKNRTPETMRTVAALEAMGTVIAGILIAKSRTKGTLAMVMKIMLRKKMVMKVQKVAGKNVAEAREVVGKVMTVRKTLLVRATAVEVEAVGVEATVVMVKMLMLAVRIPTMKAMIRAPPTIRELTQMPTNPVLPIRAIDVTATTANHIVPKARTIQNPAAKAMIRIPTMEVPRKQPRPKTISKTFSKGSNFPL